MRGDDVRSGIIKKRRVKMAGTRRLGAPAADTTRGEEPQARIVEQNGRATAVEVACTCGRKIHLQLDYPAGQDTPLAEPTAQPGEAPG